MSLTDTGTLRLFSPFVRVHECPHCKTKMDRDVNAARNILFRSGLVPAPWVDQPPASRA